MLAAADYRLLWFFGAHVRTRVYLREKTRFTGSFQRALLIPPPVSTRVGCLSVELSNGCFVISNTEGCFV